MIAALAGSGERIRFNLVMVAAPAIALLGFLALGNVAAFLMIAYPTVWEPRAGIVRSSDARSTIAGPGDADRHPSPVSIVQASIAGNGASRLLELDSPDSPISAALAIPGDPAGRLAIPTDAAAQRTHTARRLSSPTPKSTHAN